MYLYLPFQIEQHVCELGILFLLPSSQSPEGGHQGLIPIVAHIPGCSALGTPIPSGG